MGVTAVLSVNMLTVIMLLTVSSLSAALGDCPVDTALFITTPKKMDALSGSCLQIPCNFSAKTEKEFDITRQIFGIWYKEDRETTGPSNVVFNSSGTVNTFPMNITGNLTMKSCTTLIYNFNTTYTGVYYFRIMNWPFRSTAICDPLHITVKDSPPSPKLEIPADLREKESVTITCSAFTPCPHSPPKLTWNLKQDSLNNMEENTDGTFTTKIQEQITLTDKHDGYNITCSASYPVNEGKDVKTAEETKTLSVSYPPKNTLASISPSGSVSAGVHVNLSCSSRAKPPVSSFIWFRINTDESMKVSEGEFYSFNATEGGVYYCVAKNELGNETSPEIHLNIEGAPAGSFSLWQALVTGGILGIVASICLGVFVWCLKSKHPTAQRTQSQTGEEISTGEPATTTEEEGKENIHYGEIDFSRMKDEPSFTSAQDRGQQQETLYAQVKVSGRANSQTQAAGSPDDLYAQVRKNNITR